MRYGDTVVNVAVTASAKPREGVDFFPLSVDFEEKLYAVGKTPGSDVYKRQDESIKMMQMIRLLPLLKKSGIL